MDKAFNQKVFESFPDQVWTGSIPGERHVGRYVLQVAAAVCMVFSAVSLLQMARKAETPAPALAQATPSPIVYQVNNAVRAEIVLPDSTAVTLNAGSTLTLAEGFGQGNRTVFLDGEGLFDVRRNRQLPFIVNTPQGNQVRVTGTRFNVNCYSDNTLFDLTLLQGNVEVITPKQEVLQVKPSEQILIKDGFRNISEKSEPQEALEWTEGILRFDHTPMRDAISRLEKWYGVQVVVEDEAVYRNSITGTFRSEPLEEVLHLICLTSRFQYTLQDKTVFIGIRK